MEHVINNAVSHYTLQCDMAQPHVIWRKPSWERSGPHLMGKNEDW